MWFEVLTVGTWCSGYGLLGCGAVLQQRQRKIIDQEPPVCRRTMQARNIGMIFGRPLPLRSMH
jgi:hypothetical protein